MAQMRSRREQVEAHRFITSRMNQALLQANPDSIERPLRRIGVSIFASVMILALIFGGFAIATLFGKGNDDPMPNHIILVKDSSAIFVYINKAGSGSVEEAPEGDPIQLWPVANFTSALLLVKPGSDGTLPVQSLKRSSLAGFPRGAYTIGIEGIPAQPPDESELLQDEVWNACSTPRVDSGTSGFQLSQLAVGDLGAEPDQLLGDDTWVLAKTAVNEETETPEYYLLWNNAKYRIEDRGSNDVATILSVLGFNTDDAVPINANVLEPLDPESPMNPPEVQDFGEPSSLEDEAGVPVTYGQPFESAGGFYTVIKGDGGDQVAEIGETMFRLLDAVTPATAVAAQERTTVDADGVYEPDNFPQGMLNEATWTVDSERPSVCVQYDPADQTDEDTTYTVAMYERAPDLLTEAAKSVQFNDDGTIFTPNDTVIEAQTVLPPGTAVLADARSDSGATIAGFTYLVDSLGYRFGLSDEGITDSTQKMLGYEGVTPISVPSEMLELVAEGPALDPRDARSQLYMNTGDMESFQTAEPSEGAEG